MSSSCLMMLDHVGLISAFSISALQHLPSAPSALQWFFVNIYSYMSLLIELFFNEKGKQAATAGDMVDPL